MSDHYCHELKCHNLNPCPEHKKAASRQLQGVINGMPGPDSQRKGYVIIGGASTWNAEDVPTTLVIGSQQVPIALEESGEFMARDVQLVAGANVGQVILKCGDAIDVTMDVETVF